METPPHVPGLTSLAAEAASGLTPLFVSLSAVRPTPRHTPLGLVGRLGNDPTAILQREISRDNVFRKPIVRPLEGDVRAIATVEDLQPRLFGERFDVPLRLLRAFLFDQRDGLVGRDGSRFERLGDGNEEAVEADKRPEAPRGGHHLFALIFAHDARQLE